MNNNQGTSKKNTQQIHEYFEYIHDRRSFLTNLLMLQIERTLKYLFITNSGGAITVLSFMGTSESVRSMPGPKWSLVCFVIGIILLGILQAYQLHHSARLVSEWKKDINCYLSKSIDWNTLIKADDKRSYIVTSLFGYACGYTAFICFLAGSGIGLFLFFYS